MTEIMIRFAGERLTEAEFKAKYPGEAARRAEMRRFAQSLPPVQRTECRRGDETDWSHENGGRGRYCGQVAKERQDPNGFCTSKRQLIEKGKRMGLEPEDTRPEL